MELFNLPNSTNVQRVVPKNAFDNYATNKQRKLFTEIVSRITWLHKLSPDTINLEARDVQEIQIFRIELKKTDEVHVVLDTIDRAIPYNIVFLLVHGEEISLSTSMKHPHPVKEDSSVIDWTFKSGWFRPDENPYQFHLKKSIDEVYRNFCIQLAGQETLSDLPIQDLVEYNRRKSDLEKQIEQLKKSIKTCPQYKKKVELNVLLKQKLSELEALYPN